MAPSGRFLDIDDVGFEPDLPSLDGLTTEALLINLLGRQLKVSRQILKQQQETNERLGYLVEYLNGIKVPSWLRKP